MRFSFLIGLVFLSALVGLASASYEVVGEISDSSDYMPSKIGVHPNTGQIYVADRVNGRIKVFDNQSYDLVAEINLNGESTKAVAFNPSANLTYVVGRSDGKPKLWVLDRGLRVVNEVELTGEGSHVYDAAFNPISDKIYITSWGAGKLFVVDAQSYNVKQLDLGNCRGVAVDLNANRVYVSVLKSYSENYVVVLDGNTDAIIGRISLPNGSAPAGVAVVENKVYVALQGLSKLAVIDGSDLLKIIDLGIGEAYEIGTQKIWSVAVMPSCGKVYVLHFDLGALYVIDVASDSVENVVSVEKYALGLGVDSSKIYVGYSVQEKIDVLLAPTSCTDFTGFSAYPPNSTNVEGGCHQIIFTFYDASGNPVEDVPVVMKVFGADTLMQRALTNEEGLAILSYCRTKAGIDTIQVFADLNDNGERDPEEPSKTLSKTWVSDKDGDGIPDDKESFGDSDGDGTPDYLDVDSDNDGILDEEEGLQDLDGDGVPNCLDEDSDNDGIPDEEEGLRDSDGDVFPDFLDSDSFGGGERKVFSDSDNDGILDFLDDDSDNDGMSDGWEKDNNLDPRDARDGENDNDDDGLSNFDEYRFGTDPNDPDSDGDGVSDGEEVKKGSDPKDSSDNISVPDLTPLGLSLLVALILALVALMRK